MSKDSFHDRQQICAGILGWAHLVAVLCLISMSSVAAQAANDIPQYRLGSGDRLSVVFFGKHVGDLSGEYEIDGAGLIPMPLVGSIRLAGLTVAEAEAAIRSAYQPDYVLDPRLSIQVLNYRPFYIMGQVNSPGSYPYVNGITVLEAVVIAGGFTKRARETSMQIIRGTDTTRTKQDATPDTVILPGDVIEIPQRYF
jgi:polysaccharide biosynthesis/export protein VpsN